MRRLQLEKQFRALIQSKSFSTIPLRAVLRLTSWSYALATYCRNLAYHYKIFRQQHVPGTIISVGNIVAGGTGKTPTTLLLAKQLSALHPTAVLTRGYLSKSEALHSPSLINPENGDPQLYGDEPLLIARRLPEVSVFVGKDRLKSAQMAIKKGCTVMILDDGMQHRRLGRDFELVVMDASDPFGQGFLLPRGLLREPLKGLSRADLIIANHATPDRFTHLQQMLAPYTQAPLVGMMMQAKQIRQFPNDEIVTLQGKKVALFCGIANPNHFRKMVQEEGAIIVKEWILNDHVAPTQQKLEKFARESLEQGADALICTEKDRVKLQEEGQGCPLPLLWIEAELVPVAGKEHWEQFLHQVQHTAQSLRR